MRDPHGILTPKKAHSLQRRKALCAALALVLFFCLLPTFAARAAEAISVDAPAPEGTWFGAASLQGDRLVLSGNEWLYEYKPGEETIYQLSKLDQEALKKAGLPDYLRLFGDKERSYALETPDEGPRLTLFSVSAEGTIEAGKSLQLKWGEALKRVKMDEAIYPPRAAVLMDGQAHLLFQVWDQNGNPDKFILSYPLEDGAVPKLREAKDVQQIAPYKEGQLLALVIDESKAWDEVTRQNRAADLYALHLEDDKLEPLGSTGQPFRYDESLMYESETDTIYMTGNAELLRKVGEGDFEVCAYLSTSQGGGLLGGQLFQLQPGQLVMVDSQGVSLRSTDPSQLPALRLHVYGGYLDEPAKKAIRQMGNVAVRFEDQNVQSAQELGQALISGAQPIDLFFLDSNYMDLSLLQMKGYCLDLGPSKTLSEHAGRAYPTLREGGMLDGKLLMVPVDLNAYTFGHYPKLFLAMGLEPPADFFALCDLIEKWNDDLVDEHADFLPLRSTNIKRDLTVIAQQLAADAAAGKGEDFSFSDPLLVKMLQRVETLRTDKLGMSLNTDSGSFEQETQELDKKIALIDRYFDLGLYSLTHMHKAMKYPELVSSERVGVGMPLQLTAQADIPFTLPVQPRMAAVNATSKHAEEARRFLELYVSNLEPAQKAAMYPDVTEPIETLNYEKMLQFTDEQLQMMKKAVEKAEGAEKTNLQADLERYEKYVANQKDWGRYQVSAEAIAQYRELMKYPYVVGPGSMRSVLFDDNIQQALERYLNNQLSLDQFLKEADAKLRLMRLETQ